MKLSKVTPGSPNSYIVIRANDNAQDCLTITINGYPEVAMNENGTALTIKIKEK